MIRRDTEAHRSGQTVPGLKPCVHPDDLAEVTERFENLSHHYGWGVLGLRQRLDRMATELLRLDRHERADERGVDVLAITAEDDYLSPQQWMLRLHRERPSAIGWNAMDRTTTTLRLDQGGWLAHGRPRVIHERYPKSYNGVDAEDA